MNFRYSVVNSLVLKNLLWVWLYQILNYRTFCFSSNSTIFSLYFLIVHSWLHVPMINLVVCWRFRFQSLFLSINAAILFWPKEVLYGVHDMIILLQLQSNWNRDKVRQIRITGILKKQEWGAVLQTQLLNNENQRKDFICCTHKGQLQNRREKKQYFS